MSITQTIDEDVVPHVENLPFFFYGTLKHRNKPWKKLRAGTLKGYAMWMLENNWFPGIKPHVKGKTHGYLWEWQGKDGEFAYVVKGMDGYEGAPYLYSRKIVEVSTRVGSIRAYVYIFNDPKNFRHGRKLKRVKGGRWKR